MEENGTMPKEAMPKEAMPKEAMPKEAMPNEAMPAQAGKTMKDNAVKHAIKHAVKHPVLHSLDLLRKIFADNMTVLEMLPLKTVCKTWKIAIAYLLLNYAYNLEFLKTQEKLLNGMIAKHTVQLDLQKKIFDHNTSCIASWKKWIEHIDKVTHARLSEKLLTIPNNDDPLLIKMSDLWLKFVHQFSSKRITLHTEIAQASCRIYEIKKKINFINYKLNECKKYLKTVLTKKEFEGYEPDGYRWFYSELRMGPCKRLFSVTQFCEKNMLPIVKIPQQPTKVLEQIDAKFKKANWIKVFPRNKSNVLVFVNPEYKIPPSAKEWYDCPICKSCLHTMFSCPEARCYVCKQKGHITRLCTKAKCTKCGIRGHHHLKCKN